MARRRWEYDGPQFCRRCEKYSYSSRSAAKRAARSRSMTTVHTYSCPSGSGFHIGHKPAKVRRGDVTGSEFADPARRRIDSVSVQAFDAVRHCVAGGQLDVIGHTAVLTIAQLSRDTGRSPTWRETAEALSTDRTLPVGELLTAPAGWEGDASQWRAQITTVLMNRLRDRGWVEFGTRARSLRPGPRAETP